MPYSYISKKFLLPRPQIGDYPDNLEEQRIADIVDRALNEVIRFQTPEKKGYGVVQEGIYIGHFVDGNSYVELQPTPNLPAIFAFINSIPVYSANTITFNGLENNQTYYLYLSLVEDRTVYPEKSSRRFGDIQPITSLTLLDNPNYILVAIATTTDNSISVNSTPTGKLILYSITDYDKDTDGIIDNTKLLDGKSLEYVLDRSHHLGTQDWETIDTTIHKVGGEDLTESERTSLRLKELFGSYHIMGELPQTSDTLTHTIPPQIVSVNGIRISLSEVNHTYILDRDAYLEVGEDGILYFEEYLNDETPNPPAGDRYRWLKVVTTSAKKSNGKVIIQRQPSVGDTITIGNYTLTAVATQGEVGNGNLKFWVGSGDNPNGWIECANSLAYAINTSEILVDATVSNNIVSLEYTNPGKNGNIPIQLNLSRLGDITSYGLSGGCNDSIIKIVDLRRYVNRYWGEPVDSVKDLPSSTVDGEIRLVKVEGTLYRYSTTKKYGEGIIRFKDTPTHGDRLQVGDVVVTATSGIEDTNKKEFSVYSPLTSLKNVLDSSLYPPSRLNTKIIDSDLHLYTITTSEDENKEIKLLVGDSNKYYLSGIVGAGSVEGWVPVNYEGTSGIGVGGTVLQRRGHIESVSGVSSYYTPVVFEKDLLFVYRAGIYQEPDIDYIVVGNSGISFITPFEEDGEDIDYIIYRPSVTVQKDITSYSFITKHKEDELVNSLDVETHYVFHSEISHDDVPITDIGDKYIHRGVYKVLGDHIGDDLAHALQPAVFRWKIRYGSTTEKFKIEASTIQDFSDILFTYDSSTVKDEQGIFEYYADVEGFVKIISFSNPYYTTAGCFSGISSEIDGIYYFSQGEVCRDTSLVGTNWIKETVADSNVWLNDVVEYSGKLWVGGSNGALYKKEGNTWSLEKYISGIGIYSVEEYQNGIILGADGEVYSYNTQSKIASSIIDIPVEKVTALANYGGILFIGTKNPTRIYKYDGEVTTLDIEFGSIGEVSCLYEHQGRLYASVSGGIYAKPGLTNDWVWEYSTDDGGEITSFVSYKGYLYAENDKRKVFQKKDTGWEKIYEFSANDYPAKLVSTVNDLFASNGGNIYKWAEGLGWLKVPEDGVDSTIYYDKEVRFTLKDPEKLKELKRSVYVYGRYKQYPTDDTWYYFLAGQGGNGGGTTPTTPPTSNVDEKVKASSTDPTAGYLSDKVKRSITVVDNKLQLVNDVDSPAPLNYYGTDGNGIRGFYSLPDLSEGTGGMPTSFVIDYRLWRGEYEGNIYFQFQTSEYSDFSVLEYDLDSKTNRAMWIMFDGNKWIDFYSEGMPTTFSHAAVYGLSFSNANSRYVRWRAYYIDDTGNTVYGDWRGGLITKTVVAADKFILTIEVQGSGSIIVVPEKDKYDRNESVTLSAIPSDNWEFSHWEVDLTGNQNPATIIMSRNKYVRAVFTSITLNITVSPVGVGKVTKSPDKTYYNKNESVTITAEPV